MTTHFRIVSLVPAATDIVAALGLGRYLVGVSHECDHPIAEGKPVVTRSRWTLANTGGAREIDEAVRQVTHVGESLFTTDRKLLAELDPDVVIGQDVCDVCAPTGSDGLPERAKLVVLSARNVDGLYLDLMKVGDAAAESGRAEQVASSVKQRLESVRVKARTGPRSRVLCIEWSDPPYAAGHWIPELVELAGGIPLLATRGAPARRLEWDDIKPLDPDVVVFMPCGYKLDAARIEGERLAAQPPFSGMRAVREGLFYATDASSLFSRCAPESVALGAETLLAILASRGQIPPAHAVRIS